MATPIPKAWQAGTLYDPGDVVEARIPAAFQFLAVQTATSRSGAIEPIWPAILGETVADGAVTWQAINVDIQEWQAIPIGKSGATEPTWPDITFAESGSFVIDGTARWKPISPVVPDARVPQTKAVLLIAGKVFAGDGEVTRFSETNNPLNWSTVGDAGFLSTATQENAEPVVSALAEYRGNLVVFGPASAQIWQVDPDPQRMTILDTVPGIGTPFSGAHVSIASDLFFLSPLGVRTLSLTAGSQNLQAGDVGAVVDPLIQPLIAGTPNPDMLFYPARGQLWAVFGAEAFVLTSSPQAGVSAWSRYTFSAPIDAWAVLDGNLYLRMGNDVFRVDEAAVTDDGAAIPVTVQWPWLDFGAFGQTKMLLGVDYTGSRPVAIEVGYDQSNPSAFTAPFTLDADTVPGQMVPLPVTAPSFSFRLTHSAAEPWEMQALTVYLNDLRPTA